jgi:hypothetical protein
MTITELVKPQGATHIQNAGDGNRVWFAYRPAPMAQDNPKYTGLYGQSVLICHDDDIYQGPWIAYGYTLPWQASPIE